MPTGEVTADGLFFHIMLILDFTEETVIALREANVNTPRRLLFTEEETYLEMAKDEAINFSKTDADAIHLFKEWYDRWALKGNSLHDHEEIKECFTHLEWDHFVAQCRRKKMIPPPPPPRPPVPPPPPRPVPTDNAPIKVSLKDYPTTTGKSIDWPKFRRKFISTSTAAGHAEVLRTNYRVPNPVTQRLAHEQFLRMNKRTFSAIDNATSDSPL